MKDMFSVDFKEVLKVFAQRCLDEKWYNVKTRDKMVSECPFCVLAANNRTKDYCGNCVLHQFINQETFDICDYIGSIKTADADWLMLIRQRVVYWLEQIAKTGKLEHLQF